MSKRDLKWRPAFQKITGHLDKEVIRTCAEFLVGAEVDLAAIDQHGVSISRRPAVVDFLNLENQCFCSGIERNLECEFIPLLGNGAHRVGGFEGSHFGVEIFDEDRSFGLNLQ